MLRWEDEVRAHAVYLRAATNAVEVSSSAACCVTIVTLGSQIYLDLHRKRTAPTNGVHRTSRA
jgi:hypothetical protein